MKNGFGSFKVSCGDNIGRRSNSNISGGVSFPLGVIFDSFAWMKVEGLTRMTVGLNSFVGLGFSDSSFSLLVFLDGMDV